MSVVHEELVHALPAEADAPSLLGDLLDLTKPRLSTLVLITTAVGYVVAPEHPRLWNLLLVVFGTAMIVASANTLNCWLERDSDRLMRRTRNRPLPARRLPHWAALVQGIVLGTVALPVIGMASNGLAALLAFVALVSYVVVYTPMKRVSSVATVVGAFPGALPPLIGWVAARGRIEAGGLALFAVLFLWQIPHFLALSVFLADDYARAGLKVLPLDGGPSATRWNVVLWTLALIPVSLLPVTLDLAGGVYAGVAIVSGLAFLGLGARGFRSNGGTRWAIGLFVGSIVYLTLLFAALVLDARA